MQKTIETLKEVSRKYRGKNLGSGEYSSKLAEDLIKTIGIEKIDSKPIIQYLIQNNYRGQNLGDTNTNSLFIDDVLHTFEKFESEVRGDLDIPDNLHEIEPPLTREQVAAKYALKEETKEEVVEKPVTNVRRKKVAKWS